MQGYAYLAGVDAMKPGRRPGPVRQAFRSSVEAHQSGPRTPLARDAAGALRSAWRPLDWALKTLG